MDTTLLTERNDQVALAIGLLASAEAEVKRLEALQLEQTDQVAQLQAEVNQLEFEMGSKVLAAIEAGKDVSKSVAAEIEGKRLQLQMRTAVCQALVPKIANVRWSVITSKASVLRFEADRLDHAATERQARTDAMLAGLQEWEGVNYVCDTGQSMQRTLHGNQVGGSPDAVLIMQPFTLQLFNRAAVLRADADNLEKGRPMETSIVTGRPVEPFEIDYEGGRVLIPEPPVYKPIKLPAPGKRELLEKVEDQKGLTVDNSEDWRRVDVSPVVLPGIAHIEG